MNLVLLRWDVKLKNWALWVISGARGVGCAVDGKWGEGAPRPPPPLVGEALDTDTLVQRLDDDLRVAVTAAYVWTGTVFERAEYLQIQPRTLNDRVDSACYDLERMWHERRSGAPALKNAHACAQLL